jgi:hypothetical protein
MSNTIQNKPNETPKEPAAGGEKDPPAGARGKPSEARLYARNVIVATKDGQRVTIDPGQPIPPGLDWAEGEIEKLEKRGTITREPPPAPAKS